jgi:hypothetical protein
MNTIITTQVVDPTSGGFIAVDTEIGLAYPLTLCCNASGKGGGEGVICRSCYMDIDWGFGAGWTLEDLPASVRDEVLAEVTS